MPVGAAIAGAAVIGGGASIISGNKAANAQRDAASQSAEIQRYMFDQSRSDQEPYRDVGQNALYKLADMYGVSRGSSGTPGSTGATDWGKYISSQADVRNDYSLHPDMSVEEYGPWHYARDGGWRDLKPYASGGAQPAQPSQGGVGEYGGFMESPGYKFRRDEGMKAIERSAASRGILGSGGTMKAVGRYADGLASSEYENYANALRSMAGVGQTSSATTGAQGIATGQGIAQSMTNAGNARASSFANTGAAINNGVSNVMGAYLQGGFGGGGSSNFARPPINYGAVGASAGSNMPSWIGG